MALRIRLKELIARWEVDHRQRLPLADLSKQTGISQQTLSKIADPTIDYATSTRHLEDLCRFFHVPLQELAFFDPPITEAKLPPPAPSQPSEDQTKTQPGNTQP